MENSTAADHRWEELVQIVRKLADLSGITFEVIAQIIAEAVIDERSGKSEDECRKIMGDKIDQYRAGKLTSATIR